MNVYTKRSTRRKSTIRAIWMVIVALVFSALTPCAPLAMAQAADPPDGNVGAAAASGAGDDGVYEVGVEYVNWYPGAGDLGGTDDDALSLYNGLGAGGWTKRFAYGNGDAWEEDWKATWRPGGGTENIYVDTVDLAYFSGHGGPSWDSYYGRTLWGPVFGDGGNTHDDSYLVPGDAYRAYGDGDLEWVVFSACQTLNNDSFPYWANSMNGLHLLLGFKTNMLDVNQGYWFAYYIRQGRTFHQAWNIATDITHPRGYVARVVANELCHYNDRFGSICADSYDTDSWYWDHEADTLVAASAARPAMPVIVDELPVFDIIAPLSTEQSATTLATALGMDAETPASLNSETSLYTANDGTRDVVIDKQGLYYFLDTTQLFSGTETLAAAAAPAISADQARQIAESYLISRSLKPADAVFYNVIADTLTSMQVSQTVASAAAVDVSVAISDEQTLSYQVIYERQLKVGGNPVAVEGPGAQLKVYVDAISGQVVGVLGGWRAVEQAAVTAAQKSETFISAEQMKKLYETFGDALSLAPSTFNANAWKVNALNQAYYEHALGNLQSQLVRVYALDVTQTNNRNNSSIETRSHVPAYAEQIAPLARIQSVGNDLPAIAGEESLTLTALDASKTLTGLGFDASLNFALGQAPYSYTWTLAHTSQTLGVGPSLTVKASQFSKSVDREEMPVLNIVLTVTDANGQTSRATQPLHVVGVTSGQRVNLPWINR